MNEYNKFIRFDWAAKRMLRDKANFGVLEGLVQVLIGEPIKIVEILESESNQEREDDNEALTWEERRMHLLHQIVTEKDKLNRFGITATNSRSETILVEIQQIRYSYYLQRVLYGVDKVITEHINLGQKYDNVKKVYSISILYFDLGRGADYLYHGQTKLIGVHTGDQLQINAKEEGIIRMVSPENIFPEYFIIRVNEFNQTAKTPLEEWLSYLKDGYISKDTTVPGLQEAREKLLYLSMSDEDRRAYDRHLDNVMVQNDMFDTAKDEGRAEGHAEGLVEGRAEGLVEGRAEGLVEGRAEGRAEEKKATACKMKELGAEPAFIAQVTGLTIEEIERLK